MLNKKPGVGKPFSGKYQFLAYVAYMYFEIR